MDIPELKEVINHLKKTVPCSQCSKTFVNEEIKIISTFNNDALLHILCNNCGNQLLVHVSVVENTSKKKPSIKTHNTISVSQDDVLDIHNFLKQFDGDFKELFT